MELDLEAVLVSRALGAAGWAPSWDQVLPLTHLVELHEDIGELNPVQKRQRETLI